MEIKIVKSKKTGIKAQFTCKAWELMHEDKNDWILQEELCEGEDNCDEDCFLASRITIAALENDPTRQVTVADVKFTEKTKKLRTFGISNSILGEDIPLSAIKIENNPDFRYAVFMKNVYNSHRITGYIPADWTFPKFESIQLKDMYATEPEIMSALQSLEVILQGGAGTQTEAGNIFACVLRNSGSTHGGLDVVYPLSQATLDYKAQLENDYPVHIYL